MTDLAISVDQLSKRYRIGRQQAPYKTVREAVTEAALRPLRAIGFRLGTKGGSDSREDSEIWALKGVSFELERGEVLGIIGRNGAGKSTLLKILAGITEPTDGSAVIHGRVGSLLEVGTGFHAELTGRENTYLNGAILGMRRSEIDTKFDEIIAFAEVAKFVDTPVKHYSSGMYLRLAFAVAAHLEPEILMVDEVLAVGDLAFQRKCLGKMGEVAQSGRTVLFVSHNIAAVRQLCSVGLLLSDGHVAAAGATADVIHEYVARSQSGVTGDLTAITDRKGAGGIRFATLRIESAGKTSAAALICGHPGRLALRVRSERRYRRVRISMLIRDGLDQRVMLLDSKLVGDELPELPQDGELVCELPRVHLAPGRYRIELFLQAESELQDWISDAGTLDVLDGDFFGTGRAIPEGYQTALMDFQWRAQEPPA